MATIPVVDTLDKRVGIISAVVLLLITFIVLWFLTYDIPNPLPTVRKVPAVAQLDEIILKDLKIDGDSSGGGTPNNSQKAEPKPVRQQAITSNKPAQTSTTTGGNATTGSSSNTQNTSTGGTSSNPFGGDGGSGGGSGGGNGTGFGQDSGEGTGTGNGIGFGTGRTRQKNVDVHNISIETSAKIYYKLTVDSDGNVVAFHHYKSKTTTTDQTLINKIGYAIKKQVKYNKAPGSPLVYQDYTISVTSN